MHQPPSSPKQTRTVVLVDDSPVMLEATSLALEDAGYRVVALDNPLMLPGVVRHETPDLILLDVNMPLIRGEDVAGIIRRMGVDVGSMVVLFSDEHELPAIAVRVGAAGAIAKSTPPEELATRVSEFIARRTSTRL